MEGSICDAGNENLPIYITCFCGNPCSCYQSKKDATKGKIFYCCGKSRDDESRCNFFCWQENIPLNILQEIRQLKSTVKNLEDKLTTRRRPGPAPHRK